MALSGASTNVALSIVSGNWMSVQGSSGAINGLLTVGGNGVIKVGQGAAASPSLRIFTDDVGFYNGGSLIGVIVNGKSRETFHLSGLTMNSGMIIKDSSGYTLPGSYMLSGAYTTSSQVVQIVSGMNLGAILNSGAVISGEAFWGATNDWARAFTLAVSGETIAAVASTLDGGTSSSGITVTGNVFFINHTGLYLAMGHHRAEAAGLSICYATSGMATTSGWSVNSTYVASFQAGAAQYHGSFTVTTHLIRFCLPNDLMYCNAAGTIYPGLPTETTMEVHRIG
jgi:hypothetical protein